jgi:D-alanyl-D-alanine carboxypeptidase
MTVLTAWFGQWRLRRQIRSLHAELGIPPDYGRKRQLPLQPEAKLLTSIGTDIFDRDQRLLAPAAEAWQSMVVAAANDGIELQIVSAYRSVDYQAGIIRRKLDGGQSIAEILQASAAPGYSEHHSGRALDLTTPGYAALEEEFEQSDAFAWLQSQAAGFGFRMSFPRDNPHRIAYEPWHWAWHGAGSLAGS